MKGRGTNVFKLFEAVDLQDHHRDPSLPPQIAYYDDGVGTEQFKPLKLVGGAFGWGLSRNVRDLYRELARVYDPGDRIYLFGFSRGAFTVRTLAGLIAHVGIVDRAKVASDGELQALVGRAYKELRQCFRRVSGRLSDASEADQRSEEFRRRWSVWNEECNAGGKCPIEFVGVWDTVDAVGFPLDEIADFWNAVVYPFKFPDTYLSPQVKRACHAIAIDDERYTFHPVLWNETKETSGRIQQVWFAGVHSNVGGGYNKQGLSLVALTWMMQQAELSGLRFIPSMRQMYTDLQNVNDKLYDSRAGLGAYYRYKPRDMAALCAQAGIAPRVHISAIERIALGTEGYAPGNLSEATIVVGDEEHRRLASQLTEVVVKHWREGRGLLNHAAKWVGVKAAAQRLFAVCSTLTAAYLVWQVGLENLIRLPSMDAWRALGRALGQAPWLVVLLVALYGLGAWCTRIIQRTYSEFWFPFRPKLREVLLSTPDRVAAAGK